MNLRPTTLRFLFAPAFALGAASLLIFGLAPRALASGTDQYGFGARAASMGGAYTALATDYSGVYYNPAGLAFTEDSTITMGFNYVDANVGYDAAGLSSRENGQVERVAPVSAITVGLASRAGKSGWASRIGLGIGLYTPTRQLIGFETESAPGDPGFFLYGSRRDKITVMPAAAFRILPLASDDEDGLKMSIGAGVLLLADLNGTITFNLDPAARTAAQTDFKLIYDVAPHLGLFVWPAEWISFGLAYRGQLSLKVDLEVVVDLDNNGVSDFPLAFEAVTLFQPQQIQVGVAIDPTDSLTLAFDLTWANWSAFKDPFITLDPIVAQVDPDAKDIFIPRVGAAFRATDAVSLRAGYYYQPSPFPDQDGATNLIDPAKHVVSLGVGYTHWDERERLFRDAEGAIQAETTPHAPVSVDLLFQFHILDQLDVTKDDPLNSGGVGSGFEADGFIWNAGIFFTFRV